MNKLIIFALVVSGLYFYMSREPSTAAIVNEMGFGEVITYQGEKYTSDWGPDTEEIEGYLRRKDRHFDENMPVVTYDLVITSGEYNDPDIVKIKHQGGGNYYWRADKQPEGALVIYHTVPASVQVQDKLDKIDQGADVTLVGKVSRNSEIRSESGSFVRLMHSNHKFILVEDTF